MANEFQNYTGVALRATAVTPADTDLTSPFRALYIGVTGNVSLRLVNDTVDVVFVGVPAGSILPFGVIRVNSTNTTASSIVGLR